MANDAKGNTSVSILNDLSKMNLSGNLSFTPRDANDLWFYSEQIFDATSDPLIKAGMQYRERAHRGDGIELETHANDQLRWLAVKNTGTTDGSTATTEGVVLAPSEFSITFGFFPSIIATQEFVVPKSIPITLAILFFLL